MRISIKIQGWAPQGEPVPKGPESAEFLLKLSALPDAVWRRLFEQQADAISTLNKHSLAYELRDEVLRVWCPVAQIASVVEGTKRMVTNVNVAAIDFDNKQSSLRMKESERHTGTRADIEAQKNKISFD